MGRIFRRTTGDPLAQDHLGKALGTRAARGAMSTLTTQWSRFALQTASTIVLARLLTPAEFGLVAMVTSLLGIGDALWNLGLQAATIQRRAITQAQVSFFFWLQAGLGVSLSLLTNALAFLIIGFYHEPDLYPIVFAMSASFTISGLLAQHQAVLARQMRFTTIAVADLVGLAVGLAFAITIAAMGGGYWALVVQALSTLVVRLVLYWYTSGWRPGVPRWEPSIGPLLRFGVNLGFSGMLTYAGSNADNVLIGKVFGAGPLGIYSRAYNLLLLPLRQIQVPLRGVAIPVLSYLQNDPPRYRRYYRTAASGLCYMAMPLLATLAALSHEIVDIMLGARWAEVAPVFQVLAISGTLQILGYTNGWIFTSVGRTGRLAAWSLVSQPILIASFFAGIPWGIVGIAWAYTITSLLLLIPGFTWAVWDSPLRVRDVLDAGWRPVTIALGCFGVASGVHLALPTQPSIVVVLAGGAAAAALMGVAALSWPAIREDITVIRGALTGRLGGKGTPAAPPAAQAADTDADDTGAATSVER